MNMTRLYMIVSLLFAVIHSESEAFNCCSYTAPKTPSSNGALTLFDSQQDENSLASTSTSTSTGTTNRQNKFNSNTQHDHFIFKVIHEGRKASVSIRQNESILSALERNGVHDDLSIPDFPQNCRRGNCLTCVGRHASTSKMESVFQDENGLSPGLPSTDNGWVLTCSSFVVGPGVVLELDQCDDVWRDHFFCSDSDGERIRLEAMAKSMRKFDERNLKRWAVKTKKALDASDDSFGVISNE